MTKYWTFLLCLDEVQRRVEARSEKYLGVL
jgi:hypothetical protein